MPGHPTRIAQRASSRSQQLLLMLGYCLALAALPVAHTITSTTAREASSPVEEAPVCASEAALVRNVECREPASATVRVAGAVRRLHQPDAAVSCLLLLPGHRWANGLLAPLRT